MTDTRSDHPNADRKRAGGFTLLELMTTLTVIGVLLTVGVPTFFDVVRNNRATANANELVNALSIARSEAIRRGVRIGVCRSSNGATCTGSWSDGWIVFRDTAVTDDANPPVVGEVLRAWPGPAGGAAVTTNPVNVGWVRFLPRGDVRTHVALPVTFTIRAADCSGEQGRQVEVNAAGRATSQRVGC